MESVVHAVPGSRAGRAHFTRRGAGSLWNNLGPVLFGPSGARSLQTTAKGGFMANQRSDTSNRGFASMDEDKQRDIASKGGKSVPDEKRSFSKDPELASEAGRKGGESVPDEKRSFSQDPERASEAGRKGGESRGGNR
jgi:general stress protein YciG